MKKLLNNKYYIIIWGIIVAVFNTVLFLTTNQTHYELASFWVSYAFIMAAFIAQLLSHIITRKDKESLGVEIPSTTMSVYLIVILIVGSVFLGLSKIIKNLWLIPFLTLFILNVTQKVKKLIIKKEKDKGLKPYLLIHNYLYIILPHHYPLYLIIFLFAAESQDHDFS